ncbi:MAG: DUF2845 domain-containing protein [Stenotrophomonas sp.]|uniref:DUF2845 domain-containing protein n=1 Tax=Stenotrophomonas sp. TaxID=69392 RepID=UPI0029B2149A|nr:DUF2845 domain-containing protein [Stenotrophomonas sp.]MDX3931842.1 DUF2845 domain-containing protein [Stenotrophomonas sp.]
MSARTMMLVLCLAAAGSAMAGGSARFGNKLVSTGDGAGKVTQVAGKPDRVIQLETDYSGNVGERWEYYRAQKTVQIIFRDGRVTEVNELYN